MNLRLKTVMIAMIMLVSSQAVAAITDKKDSWEFSHRYEMDIMPDLADIDENGIMDFMEDSSNSKNSFNLVDGMLSITSVGGKIGIYNDADDGSWRTLAPTRSSGFTIELRLRVNTHSDPVNGAIAVTATASDSNADSLFCIGTNFVNWGYNTGKILCEADNSDGFHTFRIAQEGGQSAGSEKFTVWRDGILLADNLTDYAPNTGLNRFQFGDLSSAYLQGNVDIGYVRFTSGAYAPVTTSVYTQLDSISFDKKFEMDVADDAVNPAGDTIEWTRGAKGAYAYSATLSDGNLCVSSDSNINATIYWESVTWTNVISPGTPFTVEARMRVDASLAADGDRAFLVSAGNGDTLGLICIGTNHVYYGANTKTLLYSGDNSDKMHIFRIACDADGAAGFQIWRDGLQIGTNLVSVASTNRLYFADNSSMFSGRGAFDYVRWTKGVFEPVLPPIPLKGTVICIQ